MKTSWIHPQASAFLQYLQRLKSDRGALANLRGALSEARRPNAWPILGGFPGAIGNPAFETVAGLWASDPDQGDGEGNLGATLAKLKSEHNSFEGRFKRLLACDENEIAERVVPVVRAAQAKGVRVNCAQLLSDLLCWKNGKAKVEWAKAFWGAADVREDMQP
jgi:hypothetical protein